MIKKRPTLPTGHSLVGLPPVVNVLHSDDRFEFYSLNTSRTSETVLFLARCPAARPTDTSRLTDWWAVQPQAVLTAFRVLTPKESPPNLCAAVLELQGRRLEGENLTEANRGSLKRLFHSMLDLVERGVLARMYPDFSPSHTWCLADEAAMCTLVPLDGPIPSEVEQVRLVASGFYRFATGIELGQLGDGVPAFLRWSKFGGEELSRIIDRCLTQHNSKIGITTLSGLNNALGRNSPEGLSPHNSSMGVGAVPLSSAQGQGLDKVAGMNALKELLRREVVAPIRNPEPYRRYGLSIPNGILLYGPPGCGKTYIARQLAEELGHFFVEIIPSELASPYIHQSVIRIREVFETAAAQAPAIMFIDEFEALVPPRGELGGHQQYKAEEVNEFLAHLNGCSEKKIFVIAATNQPDKIDPAVRRTGRLDKLIYVGPPDAEARREMLALHLEGRPVATDVDLGELSNALEGYSASDIRFLVDEAARDALRSGQDITQDSFRTAMVRIHPSVTTEIEAQYQSIEQRGV